jgi:hypothetical protein
MIGLLCFVPAVWASPFKSKIWLAADNAALRHQLIVLRRKVRGRAQLTNNDRWFLVQLYRWFPSILKVLTIIRPETLGRWHRAGFRSYWRWKSRSLGGRPQIETGLRALIGRSGASRVELIKAVQISLRIGTERGFFNEASDHFYFGVCCSIRRRDRHTAISFDRAVRRNRYHVRRCK